MGIRQDMDGAWSSCLQVGAVPAGRYTVSLQQILLDAGPIPPAVSSIPAPTNSPHLDLSLSPASGPPGTRVSVTGVLSAPVANRPDDADLCWDGCPGGLQYEGVPLTWSAPTTFHTSMVVPAAPWLKADPARVVMLSSGDYSVGVQCLGEQKGCALSSPQAITTFDLQVPPDGAPAWCLTAAACAQLHVSPDAALPEESLTVSGFAPLLSVIGADQPFAYQLQVFTGALTGPEVRFDTANDFGGVEAFFGEGGLTVEPAPSFASLGHLDVVSELGNGPPAVSADPARPTALAWCSAHAVVISINGKTTTLSTAAAAATLQQLPITTVPDWSPTCTSAALLPGAPASAHAVAAEFPVGPADQDPMSADVVLATRDDGRSWTTIPTPAASDIFSFGGFRYQDGALAALFTPRHGSQPEAETTTDGGASWQPNALACPSSGPCVTLGPYQTGNCAKGQGSQPVLYFTTVGQQWTQPSWANQVSTCAPAQVAATADGAELLVDSTSAYLLRRSTDGGASWADISVPLLPGQEPGTDPGLGEDDVTLLPDGALLARAQTDPPNQLLLLPPAATTWCPVRGPGSAITADLFQPLTIAAGHLWWRIYDNAQVSLHNIDITALHC